MITKEQYNEINDLCQDYMKKYNGTYAGTLNSREFQGGILKSLELIKRIVENA